MKKNYLNLMVLVILMSCCFNIEANAQEKELKLPCAEMKSEKGFLRGWGTGTSSEAMIARKKARISAMSELAASLETVIESATEDYATEVGQDMDTESRSFFSDKVKASVKKVLRGVVPVCDEWTKDKTTGKFVSYVVVEIPAGDFSKGVAKDVAKQILGDSKKDDGPKVDAKQLEEKFNEEFYRMLK